MAKLTRPSYPFLAISDDEVITPSDDSLSVDATLAKEEEYCSRLHFRMDKSVWDVIHNEMMDWRDSTWTSMNLPENKTCEDTVLESCRCDHRGHADSNA